MNLAFSSVLLGRHSAVLCLAVPSVAFATAVMLVGLAPTPAAAELLVYEGFNYTTGDPIPGGTGVALNGQGTAGELGLTGTWTTSNSGGSNVPNSTTVYPQGSPTGITANTTFVPNPFNGTVANLSTSGGFFGPTNATNSATELPANHTNGTDHMFAHRSLASSVTATFVTGNTTWFSFVSARGYSANARSPSFYIGAGQLAPDRGNVATAPGIGGGGSVADGPRIFPTYWNNGLISSSGTNNVVDTEARTWEGFGTPNIVVGKIEWNADTNGGDVISLFSFLETDTLTMAAFDAGIAATPLLSSRNWAALSPVLDETTFNTISIAGGRYVADELRIGMTFSSVTPAVVPEPSSLVILGLGGVLMLVRRRRN